jgi:glycerol uptake facilitator-like aquaporin
MFLCLRRCQHRRMPNTPTLLPDVTITVPQPRVPLARRAAAEFVGTAALVAIVVGSGIQATSLSSDVGVQLLANALATAAGLGVLLLLLGPVSGAHLNPVVTVVDWWNVRHQGGDDGITTREVGAYLAAQTSGAIAGAVLADAMFGREIAAWSTQDKSAGHLLLAEVVATAGLVLLVLGLVRTDRLRYAPVAASAYIGAAIWFTASSSFANPAATVGRAFSDSFTGIEPASVPGFVAAQCLGAAVGLALTTTVFGRPAERPTAG